MVGKSLLTHGFKNTISSLEILYKQKLWVKTNIFVMFLSALSTCRVETFCCLHTVHVNKNIMKVMYVHQNTLVITKAKLQHCVKQLCGTLYSNDRASLNSK